MSEKSLQEAVDLKEHMLVLTWSQKICAQCTHDSCPLKVWLNIIYGLEISGSDPVAVHIISDTGHINVSYQVLNSP